MRRRRCTGRSLQGEGAAAAIALDKSQPLNDTIGTSLRLDVTQASKAHAAGVANDGYWGIPVKPNTRYRAVVLREGGSRIRRLGCGLDSEQRREDDLRLGNRRRCERDVEAVRS